MKYQKGLAAPVAIALVLILIGAIFYFYNRSADNSVNQDGTPQSGINSSNNNSAPDGTATAIIDDKGNWTEFTNTEYGYVISYPPEWARAGSGATVSISTGIPRIDITSKTFATTTSATNFARSSGATGGLVQTSINGFPAIQTTEGDSTVFYIVNGRIGNRVAMKNPGGSSDTLNAILQTFTVVPR